VNKSRRNSPTKRKEVLDRLKFNRTGADPGAFPKRIS